MNIRISLNGTRKFRFHHKSTKHLISLIKKLRCIHEVDTEEKL
jgi:hypothetical protein